MQAGRQTNQAVRQARKAGQTSRQTGQASKQAGSQTSQAGRQGRQGRQARQALVEVPPHCHRDPGLIRCCRWGKVGSSGGLWGCLRTHDVT